MQLQKSRSHNFTLFLHRSRAAAINGNNVKKNPAETLKEISRTLHLDNATVRCIKMKQASEMYTFGRMVTDSNSFLVGVKEVLAV